MSRPPRPSAVLVHGLGGSPATMAPLADALRAGGVTVDTPTLAGHGTRPEALLDVGWDDWVGALASAIERAARHGLGGVVVIGQSMGGTLALDAALSGAPVSAVVCINAPVLPTDPEALELLPPDEELVDVGPADLADPGAVEDGAYTQLPAGALRAMAAGTATVHDHLHEVTVPVLVVTSRHDAVVDPWNGDELARRVAGPVTRVTLEHSAHVATLDLDRDQLAVAVLDLIATTPAANAPPCRGDRE